MKQLVDALASIGLTTSGRRVGFDEFLAAPGVHIVHLNSPDHFIVVLRSDLHSVSFFDDHGRHRTIPARQLAKRWSGNVLQVSRPSQARLPKPLGGSQNPPPATQFDTLFVDKGDIPFTSSEERIKHEFPIRNAGTTELTIKKVHTTCACLAAEKPETSIPPGGTGTIVLQYSVDGRRRSFVHEALVETNDPALPSVVLRAAGNTNTIVSVYPPSLDLGHVAIGSEHPVLVVVRYWGEEPFQLKPGEAKLPGLELTSLDPADPEVARQVWPGARGRLNLGESTGILRVLFTAKHIPTGHVMGTIPIGTNISRFREITIPYSATVVEPVVSRPPFVSFGQVKASEGAECTIALQSLVNKPFRVVSVGFERSGLSSSINQEQGGTHRATIRLFGDGTTVAGMRGTNVLVRIVSDEREFELKLPIYAWPAGGDT
jgi:hypothetical protein